MIVLVPRPTNTFTAVVPPTDQPDFTALSSTSSAESSFHECLHGETAATQQPTFLRCLEIDATHDLQLFQAVGSRQCHIRHLRLEAVIQTDHHLLQCHTLRLVIVIAHTGSSGIRVCATTLKGAGSPRSLFWQTGYTGHSLSVLELDYGKWKVGRLRLRPRHDRGDTSPYRKYDVPESARRIYPFLTCAYYSK